MGKLPEQPRYLPAEDTELLVESLKEAKGGACLEIGFGSGAAISSVADRFGVAAATDLLDVEQAAMARRKGVDLVIADRARCFRDSSFDLVFSNPPYLPSDSIEDRSVDGGPTGIEVPIRFVEEGARVMKQEGAMLVLLSDKGDLAGFEKGCESMGLKTEEISRRRVFYENLAVFRLERRRVKAKDPPKRKGAL